MVAPAGGQGAQDFPSRPITLIVPFQAGVSADLLFRGIAESAAKHLGQPVIVDNKPGGSATLGPATMAATAKPDGYTIGQIAIPMFRVPYMQKTTFDPVKDFTYILNLGGYTLGAVVKADGPFKAWSDVIAFAKANPGKFTYATIGPATTNAIATELMARQHVATWTPTSLAIDGMAAKQENRLSGFMWSMQAARIALTLPVRAASRQMANTTRALVAAKDLRSPIFQAGGRLLAASRSACLLYVRL